MSDPVVAVVGSINRDVVVEAPAFPVRGQTVAGSAVRSSIGGKGANQAVAAALVDARVLMAARVGDDDAGRSAVAALNADGVDTALVAVSTREPTGTALITVAENDNTIVVVAGANYDWPPGWPSGDEDALAVLHRADVVLAQLEVPLAVVAASAAATGGRFVLNAAPAAALPDSLLAACDVLVVNELELAVVAGSDEPTGSGRNINQAHERVRARGVEVVVTTLGARGALVTDASSTYEIKAPPATVVDTTGAGDAFTGVLCAKLAGGYAPAEAARWAAAAGSYAVRAAGTRASYPDAVSLGALLHEAAGP
ncbi:MAG: ribokinase [Jatrophihabitans sp.]|uniref:ribokinase n=1 Tax=Jatrophihabitans sp. TaxID=1932789 RepID=UPI00391445B3